MAVNSGSNILEKNSTPKEPSQKEQSGHNGSTALAKLGRRQWMVLFFMGATVIAIELRNHAHMWQEHQSGQTIWTDGELIWEIIVFGLLLPFVTGLVLRHMQRTAVQSDRIARELEVRQAVVERMHLARSWDELVGQIVATPGAIASADRAWLLAQRSGNERFDQIARWERPGTELAWPSRPVSSAVCEGCVAAKSPEGAGVVACRHANADGTMAHNNRYCLWLSSASTRKAALLFEVPAPPTSDQVRLLNDIGHEMALAIDSAASHHREQRHLDSARDERLRIARDLHDTLGQNVAFLRLKLERLTTSQLTADRDEFQNQLVKMLAVADEAYGQLRDTLEELRTKEHPDLEEAVGVYAGQVAERAGFTLHVDSLGQPLALPPRQARQIAYIAREAVNNVEKHAGAQHVDVSLEWREAELRLKVRDDGKGFRVQESGRVDAYGLAIMRERARAINANLTLSSAPGEGTEVSLILPLAVVTP